MFIGEQMGKESVICTCSGILFGFTKKEIYHPISVAQ